MMPDRTTIIKALVKGLLGLLVAVVVGLVVAGWWAWHHGEEWLERSVRYRVTQAIDEASVEGYHFTMEDLRTEARAGRLVITGAELSFDPALLDSVRYGSFRYLFAAKAERIELRGLSYWRLLWKGEFRVEAFELSGPELDYFVGGDQVTFSEPFSRFEKGAAPQISLLSADTVVVLNASAMMDDPSDRLPLLNVSGLSLRSTAVQVTMRERRGGVRLEVGGAELEMDSLSSQLGDGDRLSIGKVYLSRSTRSGHIGQVRVHHEGADTSSSDALRRSITDLKLDGIRLSGLDVDRLIADQSLHIGHMLLHGLRLEVALDKGVPAAAPTPKQLPTAALLGVGFPVRIDTLSVEGMDVIYRERDDDTDRWGEITFTELKGRFLNVSNVRKAIEQHPRILGEFSGLLFDSAAVQGSYTADLDGSERFTFLATVSDLPLEQVNSVSKPLLRVQMNGGRLNSLTMNMEGDARRAKGTLAMHYSDLLVQVEPGTPREMRHSMFGSVIETMLKEVYGGGLSADSERSFSVDRDQNRSLLNFIWQAVREGMARNLAPEAWSRMRSMLRTSAEQRREQRALRRERREQRR